MRPVRLLRLTRCPLLAVNDRLRIFLGNTEFNGVPMRFNEEGVEDDDTRELADLPAVPDEQPERATNATAPSNGTRNRCMAQSSPGGLSAR